MNKIVIVFCLAVYSSLSFAKNLTCEVIEGSQALDGKIEISFTEFQVETIDYKESNGTQRIYSRTNSDSTNRGGYSVGYCNPDGNEISAYSGINIHSRCKAEKSSDDVFFSFSLNKDLTEGKFSIAYLGSEVLTKKASLTNCH